MTDCVICGKAMTALLDFPGMPITELYEPWTPVFETGRGLQDQEFMYCQDCSHGSLKHVIPADTLYGAGYQTKSARSEGAVHALHAFRQFTGSSDGFGTVIDIGGNDGSLLAYYSGRRIAIDPNAASQYENMHVIFEHASFSDFCDGPWLFLCSHTFEHVADPHPFLWQLSQLMRTGDVAHFQFPSLELLVEDSRFDQVNHQHIHYYSLSSVSRLLEQYGFSITKLRWNADHYGTLMISFIKGQKPKFLIEKRVTTTDLLMSHKCFFEQCYATNARLLRTPAVAYGAGHTLPLLAYHIPQLEGADELLDEDTSKHGMRYVNFNKKIEAPGELYGRTFVVTAAATKHAQRAIARKLMDAGARDVIIPLGVL